MKGRAFKYIYGPVSSWRLGKSLGVDILSQDKKICSFDCIYCQAGENDLLTLKRSEFVKTEDVLNEIKSLPDIDIDCITFSGRGEPALASNLGEVILKIKKIRSEPIAVLTNATLFYKEDVKRDLKCADYVIAKLDAASESAFNNINRAHHDLDFKSYLDGIKNFRNQYNGKFAIQVMFLDNNKNDALKLAEIVGEINPDEVQLNTPLRPVSVSPVSREEMGRIKSFFNALDTICVYDAEIKKVKPINEEDTIRRRGKTSS